MLMKVTVMKFVRFYRSWAGSESSNDGVALKSGASNDNVFKIATLILTAVCISAAFTNGALAETRYERDCRLNHGLDKEIVKGIGPFSDGQVIPFDTPSWYWQQGTWFRVPIGYQNPYVSEEHLPLVFDREKQKQWLAERKDYTGFDPETETYDPELVTETFFGAYFVFSMPSGRPVERDRRDVIAMRPCEAGRDNASGGEFAVMFRIQWAFMDGSEDSDFARGFKFSEQLLATRGYLFTQNPGRKRHTTTEHNRDGPISGLKPLSIYSNDGRRAVKFKSVSPFIGPNVPVNPQCWGDVWDKPLDLHLYIVLPGDQCQFGTEERWRAPVEKAI